MSLPDETFTAEELVKFYASCDDSVDLINGVIADNWVNNNYATLDQAGKNALVDRNVESLEWRMSIDAIVADSTSKTPYTNAIAAGKTYIADNS
jgi:hypothetical protein